MYGLGLPVENRPNMAYFYTTQPPLEFSSGLHGDGSNFISDLANGVPGAAMKFLGVLFVVAIGVNIITNKGRLKW